MAYGIYNSGSGSLLELDEVPCTEEAKPYANFLMDFGFQFKICTSWYTVVLFDDKDYIYQASLDFGKKWERHELVAIMNYSVEALKQREVARVKGLVAKL